MKQGGIGGAGVLGVAVFRAVVVLDLVGGLALGHEGGEQVVRAELVEDEAVGAPGPAAGA